MSRFLVVRTQDGSTLSIPFDNIGYIDTDTITVEDKTKYKVAIGTKRRRQYKVLGVYDSKEDVARIIKDLTIKISDDYNNIAPLFFEMPAAN